MSDAKPFAEVRTLRPQSTEPDAVCVGKLALSFHGCPTIAQRRADKLNAAVARARREAAAEALEEAAKKWPKGRGKFDSGDFGLWLEAEASALRKGDG